MPVALTASAIGGALLVGYLLGRIRPWDHLDTWIWRRITFGGPWTKSAWQTYLTLTIHAVVRPRLSWHAWKHRNDPRERPGPLAVRNLTGSADDEGEASQ